MSFVWDTKKAAANHRKHGVSFKKHLVRCATLFLLPRAILIIRKMNDRFVTFGVSSRGRLLAVAHTERGNSIRIISARLATNAERQIYEEG